MTRYAPATFQPIVRPDWGGVLSYLSEKEKSEILEALLKYPSVECQSKFWLETIKPDLDLQYKKFIEICAAKSRGVRNRWSKKDQDDDIDVYNTSNTDVIDVYNTSNRDVIDTESESESESECESECESKRESEKKEIIHTWNDIAQKYGLAKIQNVNGNRMKSFMQRLRESKAKTIQEFFDKIRCAIDDSLFLQGKRQVRDGSEWLFVNADWSADFDFFMRQKTFAKAMEGGYDDPSVRRMKARGNQNAIAENQDLPIPD